MSDPNVLMHERVARLETKVDAILRNHLPHIEKRVNSLSARVWGILVLLVTNLAAAVALLLSK